MAKDYAPLRPNQLKPFVRSNTPPTDQDCLWLKTGEFAGLYYFDANLGTSGAWISNAPRTLQFGEDTADNQHLATAGISNAGTTTGFWLPGTWRVRSYSIHVRGCNSATKNYDIRTRQLDNNDNVVLGTVTSTEVADDRHNGDNFNLNLFLNSKALNVFVQGEGSQVADASLFLDVHKTFGDAGG